MKKLINRLKLLRDFYFRKTQVSGLPLELVIEATNKCNLACIMCPHKSMTRPIGFMKMNLYQKIIDEVADFLELIYIHNIGEPLFHPEIFAMIQYAKSKGLNVGLSTNGTLLTEKKASELLSSGLDYLIISIDAVTAKTYQKVRGGKNFKAVVENTENFLKLKRKSPKAPYTSLQFIVLKENEKEIKAFNKKWQGLGADSIRIKPVIDIVRQNKIRNLPHRPCFYLWRQLNAVSWDGKFVTPCCMDGNGDYTLGDVNQDSVRKIWNNPKMVALRTAHLNGDWEKLALCRDCTYPQPSMPGKVGSLIFPDMVVKKILPYLERISLGRFHVYD